MLRLSIDSKAKVNIGKLSRGGKARVLEPLQADDHDHYRQATLVPFGILDVLGNQLSIYFGESAETSDFIVDCLSAWWQRHQADYPEIEEWVIDLDNGPALNSHRTQFIKRMVEFAQAVQLKIRLIYYPPDHSKYNSIERCWAALEHYWNGAILDTVETALRWAANMTWNGFTPIVALVDTVYPKGIKLSEHELKPFCEHWHRSETLPKWDVTIIPTYGILFFCEPLIIVSTKTSTGLSVNAALDEGKYPTGIRVSKEQFNSILVEPDTFHGEWNYQILPMQQSQ